MDNAALEISPRAVFRLTSRCNGMTAIMGGTALILCRIEADNRVEYLIAFMVMKGNDILSSST